jgi:hypothetical protein
MRLPGAFSIISFTILLAAGGVSAALCQQSAETAAHIISSTPDVAVGSFHRAMCPDGIGGHH